MSKMPQVGLFIVSIVFIVGASAQSQNSKPVSGQARDEVIYPGEISDAALVKKTKNRKTGKAPTAVGLLPDSDQQYWILLEDMEYEIGDSGVKIIVPVGFVTDLASIPQALWATGLTVNGRYGRAAIIHDYLYWAQVCTRPQSDRLMVLAMKESNVSNFDEKAIYAGVSLGGRSSWEANTKLRSKTYIRFVPKDRPRPPPNMGWEEYRFRLMMNNVRDPKFDGNPPYCIFGNTTKIPGPSSAKPILVAEAAKVEEIGTIASKIPAGAPKLIDLKPPTFLRDFDDEKFQEWWTRNVGVIGSDALSEIGAKPVVELNR
ncbi:DUF1353 domain-containing protein [Variovorax sp. RB2P76]|uniref:DUF1353 domain-containing protein n=1 Tax=Variovorax sp. RB2P76 TaxID=3443736 RepID=UPI003F448F37